MTSTVIARRYAKALFMVGKGEDKLEAFGRLLQDLLAFLEENPDVEAALVSRVFPADVKQQVVDKILSAFEVDEIMANFLRLLVERRRIQYLRQIINCFQEFLDEEMGVVRAVVRTAVPLPDDLQDKLAEVLAQISGKQVALELEEDPEIIGGVVAHIGDMVWDGSIRSQLEGFKESIREG